MAQTDVKGGWISNSKSIKLGATDMASSRFGQEKTSQYSGEPTDTKTNNQQSTRTKTRDFSVRRKKISP